MKSLRNRDKDVRRNSSLLRCLESTLPGRTPGTYCVNGGALRATREWHNAAKRRVRLHTALALTSTDVGFRDAMLAKCMSNTVCADISHRNKHREVHTAP